MSFGIAFGRTYFFVELRLNADTGGRSADAHGPVINSVGGRLVAGHSAHDGKAMHPCYVPGNGGGHLGRRRAASFLQEGSAGGVGTYFQMRCILRRHFITRTGEHDNPRSRCHCLAEMRIRGATGLVVPEKCPGESVSGPGERVAGVAALREKELALTPLPWIGRRGPGRPPMPSRLRSPGTPPRSRIASVLIAFSHDISCRGVRAPLQPERCFVLVGLFTRDPVSGAMGQTPEIHNR